MKIVIKLGTSTLAHETGRLNIRRVEQLCKVISDLKNAGNEIIMVSSGAIGMGVGKLNLGSKPTDIPTKQAAASVGQCELMYTYDKLFSEYNHTVAQILLTDEDIADEGRCANFKNTLCRLIELDVIPIINENDTIATDEIVIGDNDTLGAIVAKTVADPHKDDNAVMLHEVTEITDEIVAMTGGAGTTLGTGGMVTKIKAAKIATAGGTDTVIANGSDPNILYSILEGKKVGTLFKAKVN